MRSKDVAKAANVSIRTLRHYHDLGLLPEPPRQENGYRDYSALDVARVLYIKRLASVGFSLADIAAMDNASSDDYETTLEALDQELGRHIKSLEEQRRTIAELRAERLDPALPPKFARAIKCFYGENSLMSDLELSDEDKAALLIASNLYSDSDSEELERFTEKAERIGALDKLLAMQTRINKLAPDTTLKEQEAIVAEALSILDPLVETLDPANWVEEDPGDWSLIDSLADAEQNPAKKAVTARIEREIEDRMRKRVEETQAQRTQQTQ